MINYQCAAFIIAGLKMQLRTVLRELTGERLLSSAHISITAKLKLENLVPATRHKHSTVGTRGSLPVTQKASPKAKGRRTFCITDHGTVGVDGKLSPSG